MAELSVVIPTRNRSKHLKECLESLFRTDPGPGEVIVVDQYSVDDTEDTARQFPLRFLKDKGPVVRMRNVGIAASKNKVVAILDDDMVVDRKWVQNLLGPYVYPDVGGVGGRVIPYGASLDHYIPSCGNIVGKIRNDGLIISNFDKPGEEPIEVDYLPGGNVSYRREALMKAGGIDDRYRGILRHDTDIGVSIRKQGYRLVYQPTALVWHKTLSKYTYQSDEWAYWYVRNSVYFYLKNVFPTAKRYFPFFFLRLLFPPEDFVRKSGVKVEGTLLLPIIVLQGIIDGFLTKAGFVRERALKVGEK